MKVCGFSSSFSEGNATVKDYELLKQYYDAKIVDFNTVFDTNAHNSIGARGSAPLITGITSMVTAHPSIFVPFLHRAKEMLAVYQPSDFDVIEKNPGYSLGDKAQKSNFRFARDQIIASSALVFGSGDLADSMAVRTKTGGPQDFAHNELFLSGKDVKKLAAAMAPIVAPLSKDCGKILEDAGKKSDNDINDLFDGVLNYEVKWGKNAVTNSGYLPKSAQIPGSGPVATPAGAAAPTKSGASREGGARRRHQKGGTWTERWVLSEADFQKLHSSVKASWYSYAWYARYALVVNGSMYLNSRLPSVAAQQMAVVTASASSYEDDKLKEFHPDGKVNYKIALVKKDGNNVVKIYQADKQLDTTDKKEFVYVNEFNLSNKSCKQLGLNENANCHAMMTKLCSNTDAAGSSKACYEGLVNNFKFQKDPSIPAADRTPTPVSKTDIAKTAHPMTVYKLLTKIKWPVVISRRDGIAYNHFTQKIEDFQAQYLKDNNERPDLSDDDLRNFLLNCAAFVNVVYPKLLNQGLIKSLSDNPGMGYVVPKLSYQTSSMLDVPDALGVAGTIRSRTNALSQVIMNSKEPRRVRFSVAMPSLNRRAPKFGGGNEQSLESHGLDDTIYNNPRLSGMGDIPSFYKTSVDRLKNAYGGMGKTLHPDVEVKLTGALDALKSSVDKYSKYYNLIADYIQVNRYVKDVSTLNPTEEDMKQHVANFKNAEEELNTSEIRLAKYMARLQRGYIQVYTDIANNNLTTGVARN